MTHRPPFSCRRCGSCCHNIQFIEALSDYHNGDGICKYLDQETNLCRIYETRPLLCNVEASYEAFFSQSLKWEEYLKRNYEGCEMLCQKKKN